jgi:hypothetical protein
MDYGSATLNLAGFWVGLIMTLLIFSALLGDHGIARAGQHILVGASLGYAGVLVIQHVLRPRLLAPLLASPMDPALWIPLALGVILLIAGLARTAHQGSDHPLPLWRRGIYSLGRVPVALLLAVGIGAGLFGALQGTLLPQFRRAAQSAFDTGAAPPDFFTGTLTLVITTATLLYLYGNPERTLAEQPVVVRRFMHGWIWLGRRAIWLAAGLIFARLLASRLSLLIARVEYLTATLSDSPLARWLERWLP